MIKIILLFAITILLISILFYLIRNRDECIDKIEGYQSSLSDNFNKLKDTTAKGFGIIKDKVSNKFNIVKDKVVDKTNDITININDKLNDTIDKTNEQETVVGVKNAYSFLSQAVNMAKTENGDLDTWFADNDNNKVGFVNKLKPYLSVVKY